MALNTTFDSLQNLLGSLPEDQRVLLSLVVYTSVILTYSLFIWKFYRFLASREIFKLNLRQYNYSNHPFLEKTLAIFLYTIEYLIILPFLVIFWFAILSVFLLILSESQDTHQILLISAAIIASTRITAYISEDLSKDVAKVLPFTVLAAFILGSSYISLPKILSRLSHIPGFFKNIVIFLVFIFIIEFVLRGIYSLVEFMKSSDPEDVEKN